jgi:hypothetical protein
MSGSKAPFLNEMSDFPLVEVPSGKMMSGGKSFPEAIKWHRS